MGACISLAAAGGGMIEGLTRGFVLPLFPLPDCSTLSLNLRRCERTKQEGPKRYWGGCKRCAAWRAPIEIVYASFEKYGPQRDVHRLIATKRCVACFRLPGPLVPALQRRARGVHKLPMPTICKGIDIVAPKSSCLECPITACVRACLRTLNRSAV